MRPAVSTEYPRLYPHPSEFAMLVVIVVYPIPVDDNPPLDNFLHHPYPQIHNIHLRMPMDRLYADRIYRHIEFSVVEFGGRGVDGSHWIAFLGSSISKSSGIEVKVSEIFNYNNFCCQQIFLMSKNWESCRTRSMKSRNPCFWSPKVGLSRRKRLKSSSNLGSSDFML